MNELGHLDWFGFLRVAPSIIDTSLDLELFKDEHLPELFHKYF
jgi:hypothetical protein